MKLSKHKVINEDESNLFNSCKCGSQFHKLFCNVTTPMRGRVQRWKKPYKTPEIQRLSFNNIKHTDNPNPKLVYHVITLRGQHLLHQVKNLRCHFNALTDSCSWRYRQCFPINISIAIILAVRTKEQCAHYSMFRGWKWTRSMSTRYCKMLDSTQQAWDRAQLGILEHHLLKMLWYETFYFNAASSDCIGN